MAAPSTATGPRSTKAGFVAHLREVLSGAAVLLQDAPVAVATEAAFVLQELPVAGLVCKTFLLLEQLVDTAKSNKGDLATLRDLCDVVISGVLEKRRSGRPELLKKGFTKLREHLDRATEVAQLCNGGCLKRLILARKISNDIAAVRSDVLAFCSVNHFIIADDTHAKLDKLGTDLHGKLDAMEQLAVTQADHEVVETEVASMAKRLDEMGKKVDAKAKASLDLEAELRSSKEARTAMETALQNMSLDSGEKAPAPPGRGEGCRVMKERSSQLVENLVGTVGSPDTNASPDRKKSDDLENLDIKPMNMFANARAFKDMCDEAMQGQCVEGHLMKQSKCYSRWKPRYFRLKDGFLTYYDKKSLVGTQTNTRMELTAHSVTSYTNTKNCFCVKTGEVMWFLLGKDEASVDEWTTAINAQIHSLFIKLYNIPEDNYWSLGLKGRFFYRMVDDAEPQWIRTYPLEAAPRTGDGLFPGEVIEVAQVLMNKEKLFLRIANDRGWTYAENPADNSSTMFEDIGGHVAEDKRKYGFPPTADEPLPILSGPGLESQHTGEALLPGERAEAVERYTPTDGSGVVFINLSDGRGWVPVSKGNGSFGVTAEDH